MKQSDLENIEHREFLISEICKIFRMPDLLLRDLQRVVMGEGPKEEGREK